MVFLFSVVEQHLHCLLLLTGNRINDDLKDLILVVNLLLLVLKNMLWLALIVQDVVRLRVGADEGSYSTLGKLKQGGKVKLQKRVGRIFKNVRRMLRIGTGRK